MKINPPSNRFLLIFRSLAVTIQVVMLVFSLYINPIFGQPKQFYPNALGFFTIQADIWVLVIFILLIINQLRGKPERGPSPLFRGAALMYIVMATIIYYFMLSREVVPTPTDNIIIWTNHIVVAVLYGIDCYLTVDSRSYKWSYLPLWLIFPVVHLLVTIIETTVFNYVRYPFLDFATLGLNYYLLVIALMTVIFSIGGASIILFNRGLKDPYRHADDTVTVRKDH